LTSYEEQPTPTSWGFKDANIRLQIHKLHTAYSSASFEQNT